MGSVFKPIVAAAALEKGISADQRFTCDVTVDVNGIGFNCHNKSGHGEINMNTAMMRSCNPYFINLALKTGGDNIYETAVKLGLGRSIELAERMKSASGSLPEMSSLKNNAVLANFAFGQGELTATPLQIAAAISVFANGGYYIAPTLIEGVSNNEGTAIEFYGDEPAPYTVISPVTAEIVKQFLVNTVNLGSGISALPIMGGAGGKTGSAQTGVYDEKGVETVHAWFAGFFPAETPKYTVVVINEGMNSGGDYAAPVFREIADRINNLEITRAQSYFDETEQ